MFKAQQDLLVSNAGLHTQDSQLASLVSEQKARLQKLEGLQGCTSGCSMVRAREEFLQKLTQQGEAAKSEQQALVS